MLGARALQLGLEALDLVAQARLAVGLEPADLALERADPVGRRERVPGGARRAAVLLGRARQPLVGQRVGLAAGVARGLGLEQLQLARAPGAAARDAAWPCSRTRSRRIAIRSAAERAANSPAWMRSRSRALLGECLLGLLAPLRHLGEQPLRLVALARAPRAPAARPRPASARASRAASRASA